MLVWFPIQTVWPWCTREEDMFRSGQLPEAHREAVKDHLVVRCYEGAFVEKEQRTKVDTKDREELLKVRGRENVQRECRW